jgi:hypothetical protein
MLTHQLSNQPRGYPEEVSGSELCNHYWLRRKPTVDREKYTLTEGTVSFPTGVSAQGKGAVLPSETLS